MLKILSTKLAKPRKNRIGIGRDSKNKYNGRIEFDGRNQVGGGEVDDDKIVKKKNYQKMSKFKNLIRSLDFFTLGARLVFIELK